MHKIEVAWNQEPHCCADEGLEPEVRLRVYDGGGGPYVVIDSKGWAFDNAEQFDEWAAYVRAQIEEMTRTVTVSEGEK